LECRPDRAFFPHPGACGPNIDPASPIRRICFVFGQNFLQILCDILIAGVSLLKHGVFRVLGDAIGIKSMVMGVQWIE
jgi:hypothetical protein